MDGGPYFRDVAERSLTATLTTPTYQSFTGSGFRA